LPEPVTFDLTVSGPEVASGRFNAVNASANLRPGDTRLLSIPIGDWTTGNYKLLLVARSRSGRFKFRNNATLQFQPKSYSVLVQLDKPMYQPGQPVRFRALIVNAALLPALTGAIDIYVEASATSLFNRNPLLTKVNRDIRAKKAHFKTIFSAANNKKRLLICSSTLSFARTTVRLNSHF
jgi:hypothetical protein